jgi:hypothetical protein
MRDWEVAPRKASETWARSIMNADAGYMSAQAVVGRGQADLRSGFSSLNSSVYCHQHLTPSKIFSRIYMYSLLSTIPIVALVAGTKLPI